jgi:hypothetical protein
MGKLRMTDKFEIYDLIGVLVPGTLAVCVVPLFFPGVMPLMAAVKFPDAFTVIALTALAILAGHLVQAIASLIEPAVYKTWGGRPSDGVFTVGLGDRYLTLALAKKLREKLAAAYGADLDDRSIFQKSMQRAEHAGGRVARFNALYAYHRAVLTLTAMVIVLFLLSFVGGLAWSMSWWKNVIILLSLALFLLLAWHRAKQRGIYYVKEVLLRAEHAIEEKDKKDDKKP